MTQEYVVDVSAPAPGESEAVAGRLAQILKLDEARVVTLVRRLPDVVTRPITFDEATAVVERFSRAGLRARIRRVTRDTAPTLFDTPAGKPTVSPGTSPVLNEPDLNDDDDLFLDTDDAGEEQFGQLFRAGTEDADEPVEPEPEPLTTPAADDPELPAADERDSRTMETFEEVTPAELQARLRGGRSEPAEQDQPDRQTLAANRTFAAATAAGTDTTAAEPVAQPRRRRGSLQSKLLSTAIIPVLLTIVGALAATWFTARPALYQQLLDSARNPAIATAASLSSAFEQTAADTGIDYLQLQSTILITRQAFPRDDIAFIIATDDAGNPLPGFFAGSESLTANAADLQNAIRDRAVEAISLGTDARAGAAGSSSQLLGAGTGIEIVAQPLIVNNEPVGAVVVGVSDAAVTAQVNRIIINVLLFSLIPLFIAILIAVRRARRLTGNVLDLTNKADEISRGELDEQVDFRSDDELDDLAAALERMRISMRGALERLRRRR